MFAPVSMDGKVPGKQKSGGHPLFSKVSSILIELYHILILKAIFIRTAEVKRNTTVIRVKDVVLTTSARCQACSAFGSWDDRVTK